MTGHGRFLMAARMDLFAAQIVIPAFSDMAPNEPQEIRVENGQPSSPKDRHGRPWDYEMRVTISGRLVLTCQLDFVAAQVVFPAFTNFATDPRRNEPTQVWVKGMQWKDWTLRGAYNLEGEPQGPPVT